VKPPGPQLELRELVVTAVALDPVSTFTAEKLRTAFSAPHAGQRGLTPSEYALMDRRISKGCPQSWQR
jgi:hypothetical protein